MLANLVKNKDDQYGVVFPNGDVLTNFKSNIQSFTNNASIIVTRLDKGETITSITIDMPVVFGKTFQCDEVNNKTTRYHKNSNIQVKYPTSSADCLTIRDLKVASWYCTVNNKSVDRYIPTVMGDDKILTEILEKIKDEEKMFTNVMNGYDGSRSADKKETPKEVNKEKEDNKMFAVKTFIGEPRAELKNAAWRVAANQLVELIREPLTNVLCEQMGMKNSRTVKNQIGKFLNTELGRGVTAAALAMAMPAIGMVLPEDVREYATRMAKELREAGYQHLMMPVAALITGPIREAITNSLKTVMAAEKIRAMTDMAEAVGEAAEKEDVAVNKTAKA